MNPEFWKGKTVLITGHNGFKGCWLTKWLDVIGAKVIGFSLPPEENSGIHQLTFSDNYVNIEADVRSKEELDTIIPYQPDVVIHLAAQAIVRIAKEKPADTFETNVMGTVNVLELCRKMPSVKSIVVVTSDKVYENVETMKAYTEESSLMGGEPYSCSKVAQEQVVCAYYESFFKSKNVGVATARASNAFGGGDYHFDRLIPYLQECAFKHQIPEIRNPQSVRPWQYVMDLLCGYLTLAEHLYQTPNDKWENYNFGPNQEELYSVSQMSDMICGQVLKAEKRQDFFEAGLLFIDSQKSKKELNWSPLYNVEQGLRITTELYQDYFENGNSDELYEKAINDYMRRLADK